MLSEGGERPSSPACRRRRVEAEGSLVPWECWVQVASGPDKVGTCQDYQMVRARRASREGIRKEPVFDTLLGLSGSNLMDMGRDHGADDAQPIGVIPVATAASRRDRLSHVTACVMVTVEAKLGA